MRILIMMSFFLQFLARNQSKMSAHLNMASAASFLESSDCSSGMPPASSGTHLSSLRRTPAQHFIIIDGTMPMRTVLTTDELVVAVLWVGLDDHDAGTRGALHGEGVQRRAVVVAHFLLLSIETHPLADHLRESQ